MSDALEGRVYPEHDERVLKIVIDHEFVAQHTIGSEAFIANCRAADWAEIEHESGLTEAAIRDAAAVYIAAEPVIGVHGAGLTQHAHGRLSKCPGSVPINDDPLQ